MPDATAASSYLPLAERSIRILSLNPGHFDSPLEAGLEHVSLTNATEKYEAISYCWGDTGFTRTLAVSGRGMLRLTESLYLALQSLRYEDRPRLLWADAVCINQTDVRERSAQVAMMGDIFSQAMRVLVWLGSCSNANTEPLAFATLSTPLEAQGGRSRDELMQLVGSHLSQAEACTCCGHSIGTSLPVTLADGLGAVAKLLERSWFGRLWVVQEVALAKEVEVYCGTHHASWYNFVEIARVPGQDEEQTSMGILPRAELRQIWARCNYLNQLRHRNRSQAKEQTAFRPTRLCNDLLMLSYLECREPLDRIFGVSKVLGLEGVVGLRADYSLPVAEIYRRTAELFLTDTANRAGGHAAIMLALVGTELKQSGALPGLPSWVPDLQHLSERSRSKHTYYQWRFAQRRYYADAFKFRCKVSTTNPSELLVRGRCFGTVKKVMPVSCPSKHVHRRLANKCPKEEALALVLWYLQCRQFLLSDQNLWPTDGMVEDQDEKISQIMSYALNVQQAFEMPDLSTELMEKWILESDIQHSPMPDVERLARDLRPYITGHPCDRDRCLGIIEGEFGTRAAWLPPTTTGGEKLCYFAGAPEPFILHPLDDSQTYQLKGDAYVDGVSECHFLCADQQDWERLLTELRSADVALKASSDPGLRPGLKHARLNVVNQIKKIVWDANETFGRIRIR